MADWFNTPLIVTASLAVLYAVVKVIRWTVTVDLKLDQSAGFTKEVREDFKEVREDFKEVREDFREVRQELKEVRQDITQIFLRLPPPPVAGDSPLQLTDFGEKMADFTKAKSWASELAPSLRADVAGKRPFEVDEFSRSFVHGRLSDDMKESVAACAYEFGVERDAVLKVLQVVLRNELLRQI